MDRTADAGACAARTWREITVLPIEPTGHRPGRKPGHAFRLMSRFLPGSLAAPHRRHPSTP